MESRKFLYFSLVPLPFSNPLIRMGMVWGPAYGARGGSRVLDFRCPIGELPTLETHHFLTVLAVGNQPPKMSPGKVGTWQEGMEGQGLDFVCSF